MQRTSSTRLALTATYSCVLLAITSVGSQSAWGQTNDKIAVKSSDDLPRHTYKIEGTVSDLLRSPEQVAGLAGLVRADIEADLAKYDIQDSTTLQGLLNTLMNIAVLEERFDDALGYVPQIRRLEEKESQKLMTGLVFEAIVGARKKTGGDQAQFCREFRDRYLKKLSTLPWDVVGDQLEKSKGKAEMMSEGMIRGLVQARLDPIVANTGEASTDVAQNIINMMVALKIYLPLRDDLIAVYGTVIDEHRVEKKDIWAERAITLLSDENLTPVTVAIWDTGTDTTVFSRQLFVNPDEKVDGKDNDGNGFVDDVHGIAFDLAFNRTAHLLRSLDDLHTDVSTASEHLKGFFDIQAAVDSPEASAVKRVFAGLKQDEVKMFVEDLTLSAHYIHGTHVAGIAVEGNPFARVLVARLTADHRVIGQEPTYELAHNIAAACRDTVDYFKRHGVRVVNMSWGFDRPSIESGLEAHGVGSSIEERAQLARRLFKIQRDALYTAMSGAPEILFVTSAGNEDNDVEFGESIPSSFELPNLLVVGAVDQAGDPTGFTSFGRTVQVYANGFEVDSFVPGGKRMKASGTSMSSPNAVNLAAKVMARKPMLRPAEVIDLIIRGADRKTVGATSILLMNPKRTLELL